MSAYSLSSTICPLGPRGHRIVVTAVAGDKRNREEVAIEIASTTCEAERRRAELLALVESHLRDRGHDVVDCCEE
jgi:hypothetical protein